MIRQYLLNWLYGLDRLGNVALGGSSQQFISTRVLIHKDDSRLAYWTYRFLNWIEPNHCEIAAKTDANPDHEVTAVWK